MRTASTIGLVGLTLVALAGSVRAQEMTATPTTTTTPTFVTTTSPAPAPVRRRNFQVGVSFLPMSLGKFTASYGGMRIPADAAFAPGVAVSVGYQVIPRYLTLAFSPQAIFNVGTKEDPTGSGNPVVLSREYDFMARVVGSLPLADTISVYLEVLPGYSLIKPSAGDAAKGFVIAGGAGVAMDLTDWMFVNLAFGYQAGFQSRVDTGKSGQIRTDVKADYYRIALGTGWRF